MDKKTTPCHELTIGDMIVDEFLRMNVRPDWQPGRKPLDPSDFVAEKRTVVKISVRMGVKNV